jgi:hypothetical protein
MFLELWALFNSLASPVDAISTVRCHDWCRQRLSICICITARNSYTPARPIHTSYPLAQCAQCAECVAYIVLKHYCRQYSLKSPYQQNNRLCTKPHAVAQAACCTMSPHSPLCCGTATISASLIGATCCHSHKPMHSICQEPCPCCHKASHCLLALLL